MEYQEIVKKFFADYRSLTMGSINKADGMFIAEALGKSQANSCLEIGVASGFSSGLMLTLMEHVNPSFQLISMDLSDTYYIDDSKRTGFLLDTTNPNPKCGFELHLGKWTADISDVLGDRQVDVAFIDAAHVHPWTLIDAMLALPHLKTGGVMILHDTYLYRTEKWSAGIGPHYLYEGVEEKKWISDPNEGSTGAIQFQHAPQHYESMFLEVLLRPWTLKAPISEEMAQATFDRLRDSYSEKFVTAVEEVFRARNQKSLAA